MAKLSLRGMFQIETLPYPTLSDGTLYLFDNGEPYILTKRKKTKRERRLRVMFFDHLKTLNYFYIKKLLIYNFTTISQLLIETLNSNFIEK